MLVCPETVFFFVDLRDILYPFTHTHHAIPYVSRTFGYLFLKLFDHNLQSWRQHGVTAKHHIRAERFVDDDEFFDFCINDDWKWNSNCLRFKCFMFFFFFFWSNPFARFVCVSVQNVRSCDDVINWPVLDLCKRRKKNAFIFMKPWKWMSIVDGCDKLYNAELHLMNNICRQETDKEWQFQLQWGIQFLSKSGGAFPPTIKSISLSQEVFYEKASFAVNIIFP